MALVVNSNATSLGIQGQVGRNQSALTSTLQKLSSGLRINSSKDDAAGMAVTETLNSRIRGNDIAMRNANDAISMTQTAEGATTQVVNNFQRIREIAVQSTNSSIQDTDRSKMQMEVDQLTQEIGRIVSSSEYNGVNLLSGGGTQTFQIGSSASTSNQISFSSSTLGGAYGVSSGATTTGTVNVSTSGNASAAISALDATIGSFVTERARFGSLQNRFDAVVSNVKNYNENLTAARSRIQDTDFASETANLTRVQILQQAGTAMLAQANQLPQNAMSLLR